MPEHDSREPLHFPVPPELANKLAQPARPAILDPVDLDALDEGLPIPALKYEYLYVFNMYVETVIPGMKKAGEQLQAFARKLDAMWDTDPTSSVTTPADLAQPIEAGAEVAISNPIVGIICKFTRKLSDDEVAKFAQEMQQDLGDAYIHYSQLELVNVSRRAVR